jgi:hypothetical protein
MSPNAIHSTLRLFTGARFFLPPPLPVLSPGDPSIIPGSSNTRPLWFDGRFLTAADLERDQNYFLQRQASLGQAAGFGVVHGLLVEQGTENDQPAPETIIIRKGDGITPSGELVMLTEDLTIRLSDLAEELKLDAQFGLSEAPQQPARTRTGIYVIALRPVEFTANPITTYPASLQAPRVTHDGDIVEATAVSLVPYPDPVNNFDASFQQAALAHKIFLTDTPAPLSDSLLPLAMISIDRDVIQWLDPYLVRRDSGPHSPAPPFGIVDPVVQEAFFMQYDARLQTVAGAFLNANPPTKANFAATDYFQALPPAGRFPIDAINTNGGTWFTQIFFPQRMPVVLTLVPEDELPAILQDSLSLPPIDLTLPADAYANIPIFALAPVPRNKYATLKASVPDEAVASALDPPPSKRRLPPDTWDAVLQTLTYGFFIRRRNEPVFPDFSTAPPPATAKKLGLLPPSPPVGALSKAAPDIRATTTAAPRTTQPQKMPRTTTTPPGTTRAK